LAGKPLTKEIKRSTKHRNIERVVQRTAKKSFDLVLSKPISLKPQSKVHDLTLMKFKSEGVIKKEEQIDHDLSFDEIPQITQRVVQKPVVYNKVPNPSRFKPLICE